MQRSLLKIAEPVPDINNPFGDDKLGRADLSKALTEMISDVEEPLVVALDGAWGTGKTLLLDRWVREYGAGALSEKGSPCVVSFNAWQDDDVDDPLLAVVGQLHRYLHARANVLKDAKVKEDLCSKVTRVGESVARIASKGIRVVSSSLAEKIGVDVAALVDVFSNFQARRVEAYADVIQARADLKARMMSLAALVHSTTGRPLVVVVDDLDRCKPMFAIALLERIKHLFNVPHVVFVLGVDIAQLSKALQGIYGDGFDAKNYLYRLLDIELHLPAPKIEPFVNHLISLYKIDAFLRAVGMARKSPAEQIDSTIKEFSSVAEYLSRRMNFSLRIIERLMREVSLIQRLHPTQNVVDATLILLCIVLRNSSLEIYGDFIKGSVEPKIILDSLIRNKPGPSNSIESAEHHLACVVYACSKNTDYATSIQTLAQAASSNEGLAGIAPALFANSPRRVLDICERAANFEINHESVLNIHKALSHFTKWNDDMW